MILISEEITIPAAPDKIWPLLSDPAVVASCIPGAALTQAGEGGTYQGTIRLRFGPTLAVFRGEATLTYDHDARRCTIDGRGGDGRGQSRALASGVVSISGGETTILKVEGGFSMSGPLEIVANDGGVELARALLAEFAQNIAKLIVADSTPAPDAAAIPLVEPQPAPEAAAAIAAARARSRPTPEQEEIAAEAAPPLEAYEPAAEPAAGPPLWRAFVGGLRVALNRKGRRET